MFATIRAFFRFLKLLSGGEYGLVNVKVLSEDFRWLRAERNRQATEIFDLQAAMFGAIDAQKTTKQELTDFRDIIFRDSMAKIPSAEEFARVKQLAEQAYDFTIGMVPQSGIVATKAGISGMSDAALEAFKK